MSDISILDEKILVVKKSVNELIAGPDRTLADLFDFTGKNLFVSPQITKKPSDIFYVLFQDWANSLEGTPTHSVRLLNRIPSKITRSIID